MLLCKASGKSKCTFSADLAAGYGRGPGVVNSYLPLAQAMSEAFTPLG
jgi:hypothetical protein